MRTQRTTPRVDGRLPRRNPATLAEARNQSAVFHGEPGEVIRVSPEKRQPSGYDLVIGDLVAVTYQPRDKSQRSQTRWIHELGDRGPGEPKARAKPLLVADGESGELSIVQARSPARFDPRRGIVG